MSVGAFDIIGLPPKRQTIRDLHGPMRHGVPCRPGDQATEQWSHGQLRYVVDVQRQKELRAIWGAVRVGSAKIGDSSPGWSLPALSSTHSKGRLAMVRRGFEHVGCKAAHFGLLSSEALAPWGQIGQGIVDVQEKPRDLALAKLLKAYGDDLMALYSDLDAMDRGLDAASGSSTWIFEQVPEHCLRLWPLRNMMRLAERRGVLFREMRYADFEGDDSFFPELPFVCLDPAIYGGGFEHEIFHFLLPIAPTEDPTAFEIGMLVLEAAAQAYNSWLLASCHSGPTYQGPANWPGVQLFTTLEEGFGITALPRQIQACSMLGLVCHPYFEPGRLEALMQRLPDGADRSLARHLIEGHLDYILHDLRWLKGIWPRYRAPIMHHLSFALQDRFSDSIPRLLADLDEVLWTLEDVDLRTYDMPAVGEASLARQKGRLLWLKALELEHLMRRHGCPDAEPSVLASVRELEALDAAQVQHLETCVALTEKLPGQRSVQELDTLGSERSELDDRVISARSALLKTVHAVRTRQLRGELGGPMVTEEHADSITDLFCSVEYSLPENTGSV